MNTRVCMVSLFAVHLKPLQHCLLISYTPVQNKKFKKQKQTKKPRQASSAGGVGLIPGQETKIPQAAWPQYMYIYFIII